MNKRLLFPLLAIVFVAGCVTVNKLGVTNLVYLYHPKSNFAELNVTPHHIAKNKTRVYYQLNLSGLLYQKPEGKDYYKARCSIHYELHPSFSQGALIDSGTVYLSDSSFYGEYYLYNSAFDIKTIYPGEFVLNVELKDLNRDNTYTTFIELFKKSESSRQNFILLNVNEQVRYSSIIGPYDQVVLKYDDKINKDLFVRYYHRDFPIAVPPFAEDSRSSFSYNADSLFVIKLNDGQTDPLLLEKEGFYHFQLDTSTRYGYTIFRFYEDFPLVNSPSLMLPPLRYITTRKEFDNMLAYESVKEAVDGFWIENTRNLTRARMMIRNYYNRVQEANILFSSYLEGWKTDRGIIYIVHGPPNIVYRQKNIERWIYGEEGNLMSITYNFVKVNNPFTDNDYEVDKSPGFKEGWYLAVDSWRR